MARGRFDLAPLRPLSADAEPAYAHTRNEIGQWHLHGDHSLAVGDLAARFAARFGGDSMARFLGLGHDAGKLAQDVQRALRLRDVDGGGRLGVSHKAEGAGLGYLLRGSSSAAVWCAFFANFGHHSQLPDKGRLDEAMAELWADPDLFAPLIERLDREVGGRFTEAAASVAIPAFLDQGTRDERRRNLELFVRMVHSALVDADYLDTATHFAGQRSISLRRPVGMTALRDCFLKWYDDRFADEPDTDVNRMRRQAFEACVAAGSHPDAGSGIYRLPAPTGSGKTLAAAAFALTHAAATGKRRVIVAVPFTSITTQNATVYRNALAGLPGEVVLEHHSNIEDPDVAEDSWRRLSAENWDAEFIVTTTVQLFESIFKGRPAASRKLHRLAGSVVVLDEIQSLPLRVLPTILTVLRQLVEQYDVTVLLASATQPAFWHLGPWSGDSASGGIALPCVDILPVDDVPAVAQRVTYELRDRPQNWDELATEVAGEQQALAIVNTTAHAQQLHAALAEVAPAGTPVLHLSTRMCAQHRFDVLAEVAATLADRAPLLLVSTQLIEAGVDVDFPVVFRAMAPAESLIQSAGRANREGNLGVGGGRVVAFEPEDARIPPGLYKDATRLTRDLFVTGCGSLTNPADLTRYYQEFYRLHASAPDPIDALRLAFDFPAVGKEFRIIDEPSATVVVTDYGNPTARSAVAALLDQLATDPRKVLTPAERRLLQRNSATMPRGRSAELLTDLVAPGILRWAGEYDASRGLLLEGGATIL